MKMPQSQTEIPKLEPSTKPTLVLDLDKTLIKSEVSMFVLSFKGSSVKKTWRDEKHDFNVYVRPGLSEFLRAMAEVYQIIVFTAARQGYADCILDQLDPEGVLFKHRLYKQHRINKVKEVSKLGRDMRHLVMIDDKPRSFAGNEANAIRIPPFDPRGGEDSELEKLTPMLLKLAKAEDVREMLRVEMGEHHRKRKRSRGPEAAKKIKMSHEAREEPERVQTLSQPAAVSASG